ncbi:Shedu immune nuclease family protein [Leptospira harrisiae]|uniref:Shedu immune nuclease family protein n=1 Tax=Leptospira harrisiae TaxID=2023189 RepID=UPI000C296A67|nr:Shedu immune nuclease family protein [Leptospira harrisiae]PKA06494.1 hypothetical protein CH366_18795 [Leptospira harrisiae]
MKKKSIKKKKYGWKKTKTGFEYFFTEGRSKQYKAKKITFIGCKTIPNGLSLLSTGGGFNQKQSKKIGGDILLKYLANRFKKKLNITITADDKLSIKESGSVLSIKLSLTKFLSILRNLGNEIEQSSAYTIESKLYTVFKSNLFSKVWEIDPPEKILKSIDITDLTDSDHKSIINFYEKYTEAYKENKEVSALVKKLIIKGKKETLNQVIVDFEKNLNDLSFDEKKWQSFLHNKVFYFIANYVESIRETDVNIGQLKNGEKKPDFVWIDIYGFLDVFEIKTPNTEIIAKRIDTSHKNYYFSSDISKAVSQIEKYVLFLERNVENYRKLIEKKTSITFSILKPKAFLIVGNTQSINSNPSKKEDFRLLRRSLKNVEIITYNELLDNLKSLAKKIEAK